MSVLWPESPSMKDAFGSTHPPGQRGRGPSWMAQLTNYCFVFIIISFTFDHTQFVDRYRNAKVSSWSRWNTKISEISLHFASRLLRKCEDGRKWILSPVTHRSWHSEILMGIKSSSQDVSTIFSGFMHGYTYISTLISLKLFGKCKEVAFTPSTLH